jgi:hypothetical protein
MKSQLWSRYAQEEMARSGTTSLDNIPISDQDFPITWEPLMEKIKK